MTRIILNGCNGKMGKCITACVAKREDCKIIAGVDIQPQQYADFPVYANIYDITQPADVIIDFSHPSALPNVLQFATDRSMGAVIATTGLSEVDIQNIHSAAKVVPIFSSFNMSLGINLLISLSKKAASILSSDFDIEILEKHHNEKIDAPSGTAIMLAQEINNTLDQKMHFVTERQTKRQKREKTEIGIHSVRGGNIVGYHEVIFAGHDEVISLSHTATSKEVFAVGAVNAAVFLPTCKPGIYDMQALIENN